MPGGGCFGCGPANPHGLQLQSHPDGPGVIAEWSPHEMHSNGTGFLCGGVIGTLLDCHAMAAVAWWMHEQLGGWPDDPSRHPEGGPFYLTSGYEVRFRRPTPLTQVTLQAEVAEHSEPEITVTGHLEADHKVRADVEACFRRFTPRHSGMPAPRDLHQRAGGDT